MQTLTVTGGNLFDLANRVLGDAQLWSVIAAANGLTDPWLDGMLTLVIPNSTNTSGAISAGG